MRKTELALRLFAALLFSFLCLMSSAFASSEEIMAPPAETETAEAETQEPEIEDTTPPTVTAGIRDKVLHVEASDSQSGVYGVMVDGNLYTTLTGGALDLRLEDYAGAGKTFSVVAVDNVGNRSAQTVIDNPYYSAATPALTSTAAPVIIYTGTQDSGASSASRNQTPASRTTTSSAAAPASSSGSTGTASVSTTVTHAVQNTTADETEEPEAEEVTITPGTGFSQNGSAVTRDLLYDKYTNKQFVTVQTRNGNTFYLVIDYDKVSDADEELYQTYFLNPVDEADLLALLDDDAISALSSSNDADAPAVCTCTDKCVVGHIDTSCPVCRTDVSKCTGVETVTPSPETTAEPEETELEPEASGGMGGRIVAVLLILGIIGSGVFYFLKNKRSKPQTAGSTDFDDYDFGEDDGDEENKEDERASP